MLWTATTPWVGSPARSRLRAHRRLMTEFHSGDGRQHRTSLSTAIRQSGAPCAAETANAMRLLGLLFQKDPI